MRKLYTRAASNAIIEEEVAAWRANIYADQQLARKRRQEQLLRDMQEEHIRRKRSAPPADLRAATTGGLNRPPVSQRVSTDEQLRDEWATKAVEIIARMGWLPAIENRDEGYLLRLKLRLKRGLRMRTIRQRVQTLDRMQRWCTLEAGQAWFSSVDKLEDFLMEMARNKAPGVSSYERVRLALVYVEAAVDPPVHLNFGDLAAPKLLMKELALKAEETKASAKREAPMLLLALLLRMERLVLGDGPNYIRAYAWVKLIAFWAAIRGEDGSWLQASSLVLTAGVGFVGNLLRTKTTGVGKKVKPREIFVADNAYLWKKDWLRCGLELWEEEDVSRDNLILLPNSDMSGFRNIGAEVQDRVALTRHTLGMAARVSLVTPTTPADRWTGKYWTEHSSRNTLWSIARVLNVPKEATDALGGWSAANSSSEVYIHTKRQNTGRVQSLVAKFARDAIEAKNADQDFTDILGERAVLDKSEEFLTKNGVVDHEIDHLATFGIADPEEAAALVRKYGWNARPEETASLTTELADEASDEALPITEGKLPNVDAWVVTTRADGMATKGCLHIVGRCHRRPSIHYQRWIVVDSSISSGQYGKACRQCFPTGLHNIALQVEEAEPEMAEGMPTEAGFDGLSSSESA